MTKELDAGVLDEMVAVAKQARSNAYAPYSNFFVGAALLSDTGRIYAGANAECVNYKGVSCAERSAICAMATAGERNIRAIAVIGPVVGKIITPCGTCRQEIREFADESTQVYSLNEDGSVGKIYTMEELLPDSFGPESLVEGQ